MVHMSLIYLSLGSNLNDRFANLRRAIDELQQVVTITAVSPVFATEPWGEVDQPPFLNICVAVSSDLSPRDLLHRVKEIERRMGRVESYRWGPRLIDIDILFYDRLIVQDDELTIPHPRIAERAFVLAPLAVLIPDFRHPQTGLTVEEMLDQVDATGVERMVELPFPTADPQAAVAHA